MVGSDTVTRLSYSTNHGMMLQGKAESALQSPFVESSLGKVQLIFTSPPFPLNRKKAYGNLTGKTYEEWLAGFAKSFVECLKPNGSIVIEIGNSWNPGEPTMSTLGLKSLLGFLESGNLNLCQQFVCQNPARLPSPAQWVNVERIRVKDAFTHIWWMSPTSRPQADNRHVLTPYSDAMRKLLETKAYNSGRRPSEHSIGTESFLQDNGGSVPMNVITAANTRATDPYLAYCREHQVRPHPARMPEQIARFFIEFLTEPDDLVLDPFAGSNVTGAVAESLGRRWISIEARNEYAEASKSRFPDDPTPRPE